MTPVPLLTNWKNRMHCLARWTVPFLLAFAPHVANAAPGALILTGGEIPISLPTQPPSEPRPITAVGRGSTSFAQLRDHLTHDAYTR